MATKQQILDFIESKDNEVHNEVAFIIHNWTTLFSNLGRFSSVKLSEVLFSKAKRYRELSMESKAIGFYDIGILLA